MSIGGSSRRSPQEEALRRVRETILDADPRMTERCSTGRSPEAGHTERCYAWNAGRERDRRNEQRREHRGPHTEGGTVDRIRRTTQEAKRDVKAAFGEVKRVAKEEKRKVKQSAKGVTTGVKRAVRGR